jgi:putative nucleotidyltransferase with HDIG domain
MPRSGHVLEAILGSCVGITLVDHESELGGLIHLLLSEPVGGTAGLRPEIYASTGLPLFIEAMEAKGAKKERLIASMAGGALVGRVSELDISLDVGGRTTDRAREILENERIPVERAETGGYVGYSLELDLSRLEVSIQPALPRAKINAKGLTAIPEQELRQSIGQVRPIPQIALKIIRIISGGEYDVADVSREVRRDQVIGARVLHLCNSPAMGLRTRVDSIDRALILLGEQTMLQIVVSAACEDYFVQSEQGYSLCRGGLYRHAVGTAITAEKLARLTRAASPDLAYTAGLLHDIGKVALDRYLSRALPFFYQRIEEEGKDLVAVERELLGRSHPEVGLMLAENWALPEPIREVIRYHHRPELADQHPALTNLVYVADLLMSRFQTGHEVEFQWAGGLPRALTRLGLGPNRLPELVELLPRSLE